MRRAAVVLVLVLGMVTPAAASGGHVSQAVEDPSEEVCAFVSARRPIKGNAICRCDAPRTATVESTRLRTGRWRTEVRWAA